IEEIEQDDSDEVYTSEKSEASSAFFICHQTQFQRHLLQRYGNSLCMLDATYRTTKYALPLFFLAVKTNVGYSVVAEFIVQIKTQASIQQGLETIQRWMAEDTNVPNGLSWKPRFFMTDFCEREIYAIETTFPETFVFLRDFHREQSWTRWTTKISNGVSGAKDKVLAMLRRCAHATTLSEFNDAVLRLNQSFEWKSNL
ncbi:uncharacterized protein LOC127722227, partial [Mytilus californianus]|uniref:uncharacterized protein LOC127722227 n=1 Tax=Mytilus californianus TaxID=6549 RepID=UPI002247E6C9